MAQFVFKNAFLSVNGVNLSSLVKSLTTNKNFAEVPATCMGNAAEYSLPGLEQPEITVDFGQDFATGLVHQTLVGLNGGATFPVVARADAGVIAVTNPQANMTARLFNYSPIGGSVGDLATTSVTFKSGDGTAMTITTA